MEISIILQARQAVAAIVLGICAGLLYDFFRALRRRFPSASFTAVLDALFWIICAFSAFLFGMSVLGGRQRLFALAAAGIGFFMYIEFFSFAGFALCRALVGGVFFLAGLIAYPAAFCVKIAKRFLNFLKKLFHNRIKHRIIREAHFLKRKRAKKTSDNLRKGAGRIEAETGRYTYESYSSDNAGLRGFHAVGTLFGHKRRKGGDGSRSGRGRRSKRRERRA